MSLSSTTNKALTKKFTLSDLRALRQSGGKLPMLTCYDFTMARLMQEAGVPALLVGDSAGNVVLGHNTTLPVPLEFMFEITASVRRGAPLAFLTADMPFGSYHESVPQGVRNVCNMIKRSGCDCVKLEIDASGASLVRRLSETGVAVMAHLGLRPQMVGLLGGYKFQGRTAEEAEKILASALHLEDAGAAVLLLEAVPPEVSKAVIERTSLPVIGCGAGPACHGSVIVTHDALGLTPTRPRFAPAIADLGVAFHAAFAGYVQSVVSGAYPAAEHDYVMPPAEKQRFNQDLQKREMNMDRGFEDSDDAPF